MTHLDHDRGTVRLYLQHLCSCNSGGGNHFCNLDDLSSCWLFSFNGIKNHQKQLTWKQRRQPTGNVSTLDTTCDVKLR